MSSKKRIVNIGIVLLISTLLLSASLFLVGCGKQATTPITTAATPATTAAPMTLKIGCSEALNVSVGVEVKKVYELIVEDFNNSGGLVVKGQRYNIKLIMYDDGYTAEGGKAAAERLVNQDGVKHLVGTFGSAPALASLAVTEPLKIINFIGGTGEQIKDPQFKYAIGGGSIGSSAMFMPGVMKLYPNAKTQICVADDTAGGHTQLEMNKKAAEANGLKTLKEMYFPAGTQDYTSVATNVATLKPDIVSCLGIAQGSSIGLIVKSCRQAGYTGPFVQSIFTPDIVPVCGEEYAEGMVCLFMDPVLLPNPSPYAIKIHDMYEAKYGAGSWNYLGAGFLNGWFEFIAAVQKADSLDSDAIMAALPGLEFEGLLSGMSTMKRPDLGNNRYVDTLQDSYNIGQYENGKFTWKAAITSEEALQCIERLYGYAGQWK